MLFRILTVRLKENIFFLFTDFVQNLKRSKDLEIGRLFSFVKSTGK